MGLRNTRGLQLAALTSLLALATPAAAQDSDHADAGVAARELGAVPAGPPRASAPSYVAAPAVQAAAYDEPVLVGAVVVEGAAALRAADFAPVISTYVGRSLDAADLKALAQGIADLARARGYVFASAWIPRQTLANGVLRVRLDEGRIDEVRVKGRANPAISRALAGLTDGRPVSRPELERALLLAEDLPGVRIAETRYGREGDRGILEADAATSRITGNVQIDNWGSRAVGPVRVRVRTDANGAFVPGDQLSLRGTLTPFQPSELATVGFDYAADTGRDGLLAGVGASYTHVEPGRRAREDEIDGRSVSLNTNLSYPIIRSLKANLWMTADFTVRDVEQDRAGALIRDDRFTTLTLGLSGYRQLLGGWVYARVALRQGLDLFDATRRGDPLASRDGGSALFTKLDGYAEWVGPLSGPLGLKVAVEGQLATRALLSSEEMGIGGPRFGRGYDYSERSGDRGLTGLIELRYDLKGLPIAGRTTQLYAFADAGHVGNFGRGGRGGSLSSAGAGVRFDLSRIFDAGFEAGFPIGHDRYETGDRSPRLSFTLSARF